MCRGTPVGTAPGTKAAHPDPQPDEAFDLGWARTGDVLGTLAYLAADASVNAVPLNLHRAMFLGS
jgi:hypothetical protein